MIVVTGASGFIGRRLAVKLAREFQSEDLRCLVKDVEDAFCRTGVELLKSHLIRPIPCELVSGRGVEGIQSPEVVFHLAGNTHTWEPDHRCNDLGTENLLHALQPVGPTTHVIFASTTAVMDNRDDFDQPLEPVPEITRQPFTSYGRSKWRAENFLRAQAQECGFRLSIVRLCTVYGPEPRPNTLFAVMKQQVARQGLASRLDWPGLTSFIHVDDVVACLMQIGGIPGLPQELAETAEIDYADRNRERSTHRSLACRQAAGPGAIDLEREEEQCGKGCSLGAFETAGKWARFSPHVSQRFAETSIATGNFLPAPGETRTYLLATESRTLAYISSQIHAAQGLPYWQLALPASAWKLFGRVHALCRVGAGRVPVWLFNPLWRFNVAVNPLFHCDPEIFGDLFPLMRPRRIGDSITEICAMRRYFSAECSVEA